MQLFGPAAESSRISEVTIDDGEGNQVSGLGGLLDLDGDGTPHVTSVIGTFIADGTSQSINAVLAVQRNLGISGLILTTVPEPSAATLLVAPAATAARRRRG